MLTPLVKPALAHLDEFLGRALEPGRLIQPSSCQTVRNRSQSPASRQSAQFSTSWRMARRSYRVLSGAVAVAD